MEHTRMFQLCLLGMLERSLASPLEDLTSKEGAYKGRILDIEKTPHQLCLDIIHSVSSRGQQLLGEQGEDKLSRTLASIQNKLIRQSSTHTHTQSHP